MQLGKYELHEILGKGGFGTVYRATDRSLDREVAFKELHPALTVDPEFVERFQREARVVARLKHPNIVPIYELDEISGHYFIVMEYLAGGSLQKRLEKEGRLSFSATLELLRQVASALHYAHSLGLVHRDLKPGNILFDTAGQAYVSDFGFAKVFSGASSSSSSGRTMVGTPPYMAPEIWLGETVSASTDIYALACMVYETLTGKPLFAGDSPPVIMNRHFQPLTGLKLPEDVPAGLEQVLLKALAASPADRYADAVKFYEAVDNLRPAPSPSGLPIVKTEPAQAPTPPVRTTASSQSQAAPVTTPPAPSTRPKPIRRGSWIWIAAAILTVILCLMVPVVGSLLSQIFNPTPAENLTILPTAAQVPFSPAATEAEAVVLQNNPTTAPVVAPSAAPIDTAVPSSLPTRAPTSVQSQATAAPYALKVCQGAVTVVCIEGYDTSNAPSSMLVMLKQSQPFNGSYYLMIDNAYFKCVTNTNYPTKLFCTGPVVASNKPLPISLYRSQPETLIAVGTFSIVVFLPAPTVDERYP